MLRSWKSLTSETAMRKTSCARHAVCNRRYTNAEHRRVTSSRRTLELNHITPFVRETFAVRRLNGRSCPHGAMAPLCHMEFFAF